MGLLGPWRVCRVAASTVADLLKQPHPQQHKYCEEYD